MANNVWDIKSNLRIQYLPTPSGSWTSIEADTYEVSIDRGILVERGVFARPDYGTAQVRLIKKDVSDLVTGPNYKANMPLRIQYQPQPDTQPTVWQSFFHGFISNVAMQFDVDSQKLKITISADDTTKILLNTRLASFSINSTYASFKQIMVKLGSDIQAVDSRFSLSQDGPGGSATFQDHRTLTDFVSGELVNVILDAELGWVYSAKDSSLQYYMTRNDVATKRTAWSNTELTISNVHSSSVDHICMNAIDLVFDTDGLVNSAKVIDDSSKVDYTKKNTTSISTYGEWPADFIIDMDIGSSPHTRLQDWAQAVVDAADPKRIDAVSCPALRRDGTTSKIIDREIGAKLQVEFVDPSNSSNKIQQVALITRIRHEISADHWETSFGLWKGI
jgi:hypothetical protein